MAEGGDSFRIPVWKLTYVSGPGAGEVYLHTPKRRSNDTSKTIVLRQINSDAQNKVWRDANSSKFKRCTLEDDEDEDEMYDDAHGVILRNGYAKDPGHAAPRVAYRRGHRIWVEHSISPRSDIQKHIPVINLDTFEAFEMPLKHICFVPQLSQSDTSGSTLAFATGPVIENFTAKKKQFQQLFFVWPSSRPEKVVHAWDNWERSRGKRTVSRKFASHRVLRKVEERRQLFLRQWTQLSQRHAPPGKVAITISENSQSMALENEETDLDDSSSCESASVSGASSTALETTWKKGTIDKSNCCNLAPGCTLKQRQGVDLVPSFIGGLRDIEHYHILDTDTAFCPEGTAHIGHCVLRDDKTWCVFSMDSVQHTCCKLRTNRILPTASGDLNDLSIPAWETVAPAEDFVDISANVCVRTDLTDRDTVPPILRPALEEMRNQHEQEGFGQQTNWATSREIPHGEHSEAQGFPTMQQSTVHHTSRADLTYFSNNPNVNLLSAMQPSHDSTPFEQVGQYLLGNGVIQYPLNPGPISALPDVSYSQVFAASNHPQHEYSTSSFYGMEDASLETWHNSLSQAPPSLQVMQTFDKPFSRTSDQAFAQSFAQTLQSSFSESIVRSSDAGSAYAGWGAAGTSDADANVADPVHQTPNLDNQAKSPDAGPATTMGRTARPRGCSEREEITRVRRKRLRSNFPEPPLYDRPGVTATLAYERANGRRSYSNARRISSSTGEMLEDKDNKEA